MKIKSTILPSLLFALAISATSVKADLTDEHSRYYNLAVRQEKKLDYIGAKKNFQKALALKDKDIGTLVKISSLLINDYTVDSENREYNLKEAIGYLTKANTLTPGDALIKLLLAKSYQDLGDYDQAIEFYQRAMTLEPNNTLLKLNLGLLYYEVREFGKSIELLNKVILAYPDNLRARSYLGASLQATENYLAAIEQYNYVLNYEKANFSIIKNIGDCWLALEQLDRAKISYKQAQLVDPNVPDLYADIAFIDQKQKNYPESIENYKKALELKDTKLWRKSMAYTLWANDDLELAVSEFKDVEEYNIAGYINQLLGKDEAAIAEYAKAVSEDPKDLKSRFNLGRLYHGSKKYKAAKEQYLNIIEQKPNDAETLYLLGVAEQETGAVTEAINYYEEIQSKHLDSDNDAISDELKLALRKNIYFNLGLAHKVMQDLEKSELNFEKALDEKFSPAADVYRELITVKMLQAKEDDARTVLMSWLKQDPTNVSARNLYADLLVSMEKERDAIEQLRLASVLDQTTQTRLKLANLLHSQNNLYDALAEYQIILKQDNKNLNAILGAANNYRSLGLRTEALNLYKKAVSENPDDMLVNYNYGLLLQEMGKLPQALDQYLKVQAINPDFSENYYALGLCYWDLKEKDKAVKVWDMFMTMSSDSDLKREVSKLMSEYEFSNIQTKQKPKETTEPTLDDSSMLDDKETLNQLILLKPELIS